MNEATTTLTRAAPAGTSPTIVQKLNEHMQKLLASPEMKAQLAENSLEVAGGSVSDSANSVRKESDYYAKFVKVFNITPSKPARSAQGGPPAACLAARHRSESDKRRCSEERPVKGHDRPLRIVVNYA